MSQKTFVNHQPQSAKRSFKPSPGVLATGKSQPRRKPTAAAMNAKKDNHSDAGRTFGLAAVILITAGLVIFFFILAAKNSSEATPVSVNEAKVEEPAAVQLPPPDTAAQDAASQEAAKKVLTELKEFQAATQNSMSFEEYDGMLNRLNASLNNTLPTFEQHSSDSDSFRHEVAAAVREYDAARNWWKTCTRNSTVLSDSDRTERLQADWNEAQTHLDNAQKYYSAFKTASD